MKRSNYYSLQMPSRCYSPYHNYYSFTTYDIKIYNTPLQHP